MKRPSFHPFGPRRSRCSELGTDDFPFRQAIGIALLIGLVTLAPATFSGFFHTLLNKAFSGIKQDPKACLFSCAAHSPQAQEKAFLLKTVNSYPLAGTCRPGAPARPGSVRPAAKVCQSAQQYCLKQYSMSDQAAVCQSKGWPVAPRGSAPVAKGK